MLANRVPDAALVGIESNTKKEQKHDFESVAGMSLALINMVLLVLLVLLMLSIDASNTKKLKQRKMTDDALHSFFGLWRRMLMEIRDWINEATLWLPIRFPFRNTARVVHINVANGYAFDSVVDRLARTPNWKSVRLKYL